LLAVLGERPGYKAVNVQDFFSLHGLYITECSSIREVQGQGNTKFTMMYVLTGQYMDKAAAKPQTMWPSIQIE